MSENNPPTFFKYCSADTAKSILLNGTLKWSSPRIFNDPFDGQIDLLLEPNEDQLANDIYKNFQKDLLSPNEVDTYISDDMNLVLNFLRLKIQQSGYIFSDDDKISLKAAALEGARHAIASFPLVNEKVKKINRDMSMFCVSETKDSITMWGYYAQDHTGVVFEFLPHIYNSPLSVARPVNYLKSIPRLSTDELLNTKSLVKRTLDIISLTKFDKWSHEKEWRVVSTMRDKTKDFEYLPFNREELGSVILGAKISQIDRNEILKITRKFFPWVEIYQVILKKTEFEIGFEKID